jgi:hypothetical protein
MPKTKARLDKVARLSRCCDLIERRLSRCRLPGARIEADWWRRPLNILSGRNRALTEEERRLSSKGTEQQLAELKAARLRLYATAQRVECERHFDDYALTEKPIDIGILVDLEEALMSASWGTGEARCKLEAPSPMSSVSNPTRLELQAKLVAAMETCPAALVPTVYAAVDRAGYPKAAARKFMDNYRNQSASGSGKRMRGNDVLFSRRDHWKGVLAELMPEGLDLDDFFQFL